MKISNVQRCVQWPEGVCDVENVANATASARHYAGSKNRPFMMGVTDATRTDERKLSCLSILRREVESTLKCANFTKRFYIPPCLHTPLPNNPARQPCATNPRNWGLSLRPAGLDPTPNSLRCRGSEKIMPNRPLAPAEHAQTATNSTPITATSESSPTPRRPPHPARRSRP